MATIDGKLYFAGENEENGLELWVYDPESTNVYNSEDPTNTSNNPRMIADIWPGSDSGFPYNLTAMAGKLYFSAENGEDGVELWVYDPSKDVESGVNPRMIADTNTQGYTDPLYLPQWQVNFTSITNNGESGWEFWVYDPESIQTYSEDPTHSLSNPRMIADIRSGTSSGGQGWFVAMGGKLYFSANNGTNGHELGL